jgi:integrase
MPIATSNMAAGDQLARSWRMTRVVASSGHAEGPHRTTSGKPPDPGAVRGQQHHAVGQQGSEGDTLGAADDGVEANDDTVLNFKQALDRANTWLAKQVAGGRSLDPNMTVGMAVTAYIATRESRSSGDVRARKSSAHYNLNRFVVPDATLNDLRLSALTEADLRSWQRRLESVSATTKQRISTDLKAALNRAFEEHRQVLPNDFPLIVRYGLRAPMIDGSDTADVARDNQVLTDAQIRSILDSAKINDADGDHFLLTLLLAATGARFSQLIRMRVADVQVKLSRIMVPPSRKGKGKSLRLIPVPIGTDVMAVVETAARGRASSEILLQRWRHRQIKPTEWERIERRPWTSASELTRWWTRVVEHAGCPGVIPYAFRHSSIVRALRAGLPIRLVAAVHDTSVVMIEKHYARWITESLDDLTARAVVPLL